MRIVKERQVKPNVIRFELDRSITGTGHETYCDPPPPDANRPPDVLARKFFEFGVISVHVFSNIVDVTLNNSGPQSEITRLKSVLESLFIYYLPGIEPTPI